MNKEKKSKKENKVSIFTRFLSVLRENYKTLIFFIIFLVIFNYPVPYYVFVSGGITDLSDRFEIEDSYEQKGSYNLSYVNEIKGNVLTYLISYIIPSWERVEVGNYQISDKETLDQIAIRDQLSLTQANQTATLLAYSRAGKEIKINDFKFYVIGLYDFLNSDKEIRIGDTLEEVDGKEIVDLNDLLYTIYNKEVSSTIKLKFARDDETYETNVKINEIENSKVIGLAFSTIYDLEIDPKITFKFSASESGSSAGLMTTLAIYDSLVPEDLTHGLKIAGTGAINSYGEVEEIAGVEYKLEGAESGGAKIFFVPDGDNYEEAIKLKKERNYDIEVVKINTLDDAIEYLKNIKN